MKTDSVEECDSLADSAYFFAQIGGWDECFDLLGEAFRIDPNDVDALFVKHLVDVRFESFIEANQCLDKILLKIPNSYTIHIAKGKVLVRLGQYQDAVNHFNKAFKLNESGIKDDFGMHVSKAGDNLCE